MVDLNSTLGFAENLFPNAPALCRPPISPVPSFPSIQPTSPPCFSFFFPSNPFPSPSFPNFPSLPSQPAPTHPPNQSDSFPLVTVIIG